MANVAQPDVPPLRLDALIEGLETSDGLFLLVQVLSSFAKLFRVLLRVFLVLIRPLRLQRYNLPGVEVSEHATFTNCDLDVVDAPLEATESIQPNELARCASALELICPLTLLAEDVPVADTQNPGAGDAVLVTVFVEEEPDAALSILLLPLLRSDWHTEDGSEVATHVDGWVIGSDNT